MMEPIDNRRLLSIAADIRLTWGSNPPVGELTAIDYGVIQFYKFLEKTGCITTSETPEPKGKEEIKRTGECPGCAYEFKKYGWGSAYCYRCSRNGLAEYRGLVDNYSGKPKSVAVGEGRLEEKEVPIECVWCERLSFFSIEDIKTLVRMYSGLEAIRKANVGHKFPSGDKVAEVSPEAEQAIKQTEKEE